MYIYIYIYSRVELIRHHMYVSVNYTCFMLLLLLLLFSGVLSILSRNINKVFINNHWL